MQVFSMVAEECNVENSRAIVNGERLRLRYRITVCVYPAVLARIVTPRLPRTGCTAGLRRDVAGHRDVSLGWRCEDSESASPARFD